MSPFTAKLSGRVQVEIQWQYGCQFKRDNFKF